MCRGTSTIYSWPHRAKGVIPTCTPISRKDRSSQRKDSAAGWRRVRRILGLGVFVVIDQETGRAIGCSSLMRMDPANGVVEIGNIWYGGALQRTTGSTEAFFLIADYVFRSLGYRRFEWKCNALHERSRRAALRFGFSFEGVFRQHMVVKGRNRDTAWFAMLDHEWEATLRPAFVAWLDPSNFDSDGNQLNRLQAFR